MKQLIIAVAILFIAFGLLSGCTKKEIQSKSVDYQTDDLTMKGYLAFDINAKGKRPGILVAHEWWGQDDHVRERADMLADLGYVALAIDMFGEGKNADSSTEASEFTKEVSENMDIKKARFMAALDFLKQQDNVDPDRIAAIGYSFGGHVVLEMARQGVDIDGVVSIYGGLTTKEPAQPDAIKARVLVQHGIKDWYVTVQNISSFKIEMKKANADYELLEYADAEHGFANTHADTRKEDFKMHLGYNKEADKKAWEDMQKFFQKIFK